MHIGRQLLERVAKHITKGQTLDQLDQYSDYRNRCPTLARPFSLPAESLKSLESAGSSGLSHFALTLPAP